MDVRRHERRGRLSRFTRDASNKENICPLEARLTTSEMICSSRSPLPPGFPRSPLQDITHIIYPPNIWPEGDDPLSGQLHKKCKKENSAEVEAPIVNVGSSGSWKGLKSCVHVRLQADVHQAEEVMSAQVNPVLISPERGAMNDSSRGQCVVEQGRFVAQAHYCEHADEDGVIDDLMISPFLLESCSKASLIDEAFFVHRDGPAGSASNATHEENEGQRVKVGHGIAPTDPLKHLGHNGVKMQHIGEKAAECSERRETLIPAQFPQDADNGASGIADKTHSPEHSKSCGAGDCIANLQKKGKVSGMLKLAMKEVNCNGQGQTAQVKKRSTLSMLR
ncbi:hypothetical protein GOP47_0002018 [Adiantum capillus-veneris]|uniref:Uncharacterized protein n=1 Tax=Adiantum capillus-veneris TaxID=13818 RepID=A0A9D4V9C9_ADICA|nr:hypothetical protein GOP47_0002018 [Adiantum capillus-veneris]